MHDLTFIDDKVVEESIRVRGNDIPVKRGMIPQSELSFYPENPRIYSIVMQGGGEPSQDLIYTKLSRMDHVKKLKKSIQLNGGLIDPVIARGDGVVLEGNSRLAAYRDLAKLDPIEWGAIDVRVLPLETSDSAIFSLLGELHIIGKTDWQPFEQAGYMYRRHTVLEVPKVELERELGVSLKEITHLINVYEYMVNSHETDTGKWSYYDAMLRSRRLKEGMNRYPGLEGRIVRMIKRGELSKAADLRDKLPKVVECGSKLVKKVISEEIGIEDAFEQADDRDDPAGVHKKLKKFRNWICDVDVNDALNALGPEARKDCAYEINRISRRIKNVVRSL